MKRIWTVNMLAAALCGSGAGNGLAATVAIPATADTALASGTANQNNNMGGLTTLPSGRTALTANSITRMLLKFDLTGQLPPGATVNSARVTVRVVKRPSAFANPRASTFTLHRLLVDWGEGNKGSGFSTGLGAGATADEATWMNRFHPATPWQSPGGQAGLDYDALASATLPVDALGPYTFGSSANLVADVQGWVDNPNSNFGWILLSQSEGVSSTARRFASREASVAGNRPVLTVDFSAPPRLENVAVVSNRFQFTFQAEAGKNYEVQQREILGLGDWELLTNVPAQGLSGPITVSQPLTSSPRFYQVVDLGP